mgnify:CR=1 FL=1
MPTGAGLSKNDELNESMKWMQKKTKYFLQTFIFAGTEKGINIFKSGRNSKWQSSNDDSIFLRLSLRY